jgi:hypothetical protein
MSTRAETNTKGPGRTRRVLATGALLSVAGLAGVAIAGTKTVATVVINTSARTATGSMGSARGNAADAGQYIGCWTAYTASTGLITGGCNAKQGATSVSCTFPGGAGQDYVRSLQMLNPDSALKFAWTSTNVCNEITVSNYSYNAPKVP